MHRDFRRPGTSRLTTRRLHRFQVLWHEVHIDVDDEVAAAQVALLEQHAHHTESAVARIALSVRSTDVGYQILDNGDLCATASSPEEMLDVLFGRVYRRATELASLKGWVRIHGAVADVGARRVVVVGAGYAGKTTLSVGLLAEGCRVEVDESFVTRDGNVFGVARRLHVKPGTLELLPTAGWLSDAPVFGELPMRAVDPTEHGFDWDIGSGPIDALFVLRRTDEPSWVRDETATQAVQNLMTQVFPVVESRQTIVRQLSSLAASVPCHALFAGPDGKAPSLVRNVVGSVSPV